MAKKKMDLDMIALILVLVGALNIGLIVVGFDLLGKIYAAVPPIVGTVVNALIGLSAVMIAYKKFIK